MAEYRLSNTAKEDLIRIHHYGIHKFGQLQADKYFNTFFEYFEIIAEHPFAFESVDYIKPGYRRCVCGVDSIFYRCLFHLKSIPGFQFKSIPLLFRKQYLKKKGVPLSSSDIVGALIVIFLFFIFSAVL
jgi:toxin ParE1/3/4